jgi:hypothetical protein
MHLKETEISQKVLLLQETACLLIIDMEITWVEWEEVEAEE